MKHDGKLAMHGHLDLRVIRAHPSRWQRLLDAIFTILGRRTA